MDYVKLEGTTLLPARVEGVSDVFQSPHFILYKPGWVPDEQSSHCELCRTKFNQIKRRHHCRMCGAIRCTKCCFQKIPLPQLGLEEPQRVCESCLTVSTLVTKARSATPDRMVEAAKGLSSFAHNGRHITKLIELGGMQAVIAMASSDKEIVLGYVVSGLHSLATYPPLHKCLVEAGAIKAVCKILSMEDISNQEIAMDGIGALMIFCKSPQLKVKVLNDGGLQPILSLCWSNDDTIALLSVRTLGLIAENPESHTAIFDNKQNASSRLLQLSNSSDEQMQEVVLKTLAFLSMGSDRHKHRLVQEDFSNGRCIQKTFDSAPNNQQILCNVACLVANLASSTEDQTGLHDLLHSVSKRLVSAESNTELLCHLTRALANFAQHKQNTNQLLDVVPTVVQYCVKSAAAPVHSQAMRFLLSLLSHQPTKVASLLMSDGAHAFLMHLAGMGNLLTCVETSLLSEAPIISPPL